MKSMTVTHAARDFSDLINRVQYQGVSIELVKSNKVVAVISPVSLKPGMRVKDLPEFFSSLPGLGEDAVQFEKDMEDIDSIIPKGKDEWEMVMSAIMEYLETCIPLHQPHLYSINVEACHQTGDMEILDAEQRVLS